MVLFSKARKRGIFDRKFFFLFTLYTYTRARAYGNLCNICFLW